MAQNEGTTKKPSSGSGARPAASKSGSGTRNAAPKSGTGTKSAAPKNSTGTRSTSSGSGTSGTRSGSAQKSVATGRSGGQSAAQRKPKNGGQQPPMTARQRAALEREEQRQREEEQTRQKKNLLSLLVFAIGLICLAVLLAPSISPQINGLLLGLFGKCAWLWCAAMMGLSLYISREDDVERIGFVCGMTACFMLAVGAFVHSVTGFADDIRSCSVKDTLYELYNEGQMKHGAGLIGGLIGALMVKIAGRVLSIIIILAAAFIIIMLLTRTSLTDLIGMIADGARGLKERAGGLADEITQAYAERSAERRAEEEQAKHERAETVRKHILPDVEDDMNSPTPKQLSSRRRYRDDEWDTEDESGEELFIENDEQQEKQRDGESLGALTEIPEFIADPDADVTDEQLEDIYMEAVNRTKRQREEELAQETFEFSQEIEQQNEDEPVVYSFPSVELLTKPEMSEDDDMLTEFRRNGDRLIEVLGEYGVAAEVTGISRGPAVTRYEILPAPGVRLSKITGLNDDIALRLAAKSVRMEAPIPGKSAVGIEIPNAAPGTVCERSLIETAMFYDAKSPVTVAIGKDIDGNNIFCDIAAMPHLLIAGSTGTGKSVCINSMLISLLYKSSPDDVRLIMVDPKAVELDVYNGIPHLLVPVVSDPKKAAGALQWAVGEMEKRYELLKQYKVRNIDNYNKLAAEDESMRRMPRILIIIDEMADLMMTSPKEVETAIARLAQMARAAGMHMILATQRPSVDVITGTIKNNIPSRIAFAVSSSIDSRTILDESGAEGLIGRGDMLFKPIGKKPIRVQGCFVSDDEVNEIVGYIKDNSTTNYDDDIALEIERNAAGGEDTGSEGGESAFAEDELFMDAVEAVIEAGQASTSMLQRRLRVGYARAGSMIDQLFDHGIIGPFKGSKPRDVLITRQQFEEMKMARMNPAPKKAPAASSVSSPRAQTQSVRVEPFVQTRIEADEPEDDIENAAAASGYETEEKKNVYIPVADDADDDDDGYAGSEELEDDGDDDDDALLDMLFPREQPTYPEKYDPENDRDYDMDFMREDYAEDDIFDEPPF